MIAYLGMKPQGGGLLAGCTLVEILLVGLLMLAVQVLLASGGKSSKLIAYHTVPVSFGVNEAPALSHYRNRNPGHCSATLI